MYWSDTTLLSQLQQIGQFHTAILNNIAYLHYGLYITPHLLSKIKWPPLYFIVKDHIYSLLQSNGIFPGYDDNTGT